MSSSTSPSPAAALSSRVSHGLGWLAGGLLLGWIGVIFLPGGAWMIEGFAHDAVMSIDAAHAMSVGMPLERYHSSFGWIYFALHRAAWWLSGGLPQREMGVMIVLTGLLFGLGLTGMYGAVKRFGAPWLALPWWGCAALLALALAPQNNGPLPLLPDLTWYGPYNHQLWAWWWLQLLAVLGWHRRCRADGGPTSRHVAIFALLQAVFLYVELHDKVNFFAAGGLLCLSSVWWMRGSAALRLLTLTGAMLLAAMALTALAGFPYETWIIDVLHALRAKGGAIAAQNAVPIYVGTAFAGCMLLRLREEAMGEDTGRAALRDITLIAAIMVVCLGNNPPLATPLVVLFCLLILLGSDAGARLHSRHSAMRAFQQGLRWGAALFLTLQIGLSADGLARMAWTKYHPPAGQILADLHGAEETHWRIWIPPSAQALTSEDSRVVHMQQANRQFVRFMQDGWTILAARAPHAAQPPRVGSLEMVNPFPWLGGGDYPADNLHWIDPGVTMNAEDAPELLARYYAGSDAVMLPVYVIPDGARQLVNCHFLLWNRAHGEPFRLLGQSDAVQVYGRAEAAPRDLDPAPHISLQVCPEFMTPEQMEAMRSAVEKVAGTK